MPLSNWPVIYTTNWNSNYSITTYRVDFHDTNVNSSPQKFYRLVPGP
jgi:hypothetical protein